MFPRRYSRETSPASSPPNRRTESLSCRRRRPTSDSPSGAATQFSGVLHLKRLAPPSLFHAPPRELASVLPRSHKLSIELGPLRSSGRKEVSRTPGANLRILDSRSAIRSADDAPA